MDAATSSTAPHSPTPACCSRPASRRCTPPARSRRRSAWRRPGSTRSTSRCFWKGFPTNASTADDPGQRRAPRRLPGAERSTSSGTRRGRPRTAASSPASTSTALALPWGGTSHPVWFKRDPRVANCQALGGVFDRALMDGVPQIVAARSRSRPTHDRGRAGGRARPRPPPGQAQMPPRENPRVNNSLDSVHASGPLGRAHCVIHGNSNYKQTGLLQAFAAYSLLQQPPRRVGLRLGLPGVRPPGAARRAAQLRAGPRPGGRPCTTELAHAAVSYLDKGASLGRDAPCLTTDGATCPTARSGRCPRGRRRAGRVAVSAPATRWRSCRQRPRRVRLRVRHRRAGRGVVPDQPAQRGRGEPRAAGAVRLRRAALPGGLRAAGRPRSRRTCRSCARWSASTASRLRARGRSAELADGGRRAVRRRPRSDDAVMIVGTGGTTGRPKGVMLTDRNLETMTAITLMSYPFDGRPVYLALAPLTHAAGVLCFPVMALGGRDRRHADAGRRRVPGERRAPPGHPHVPAADGDLHGARARRPAATDLSSLQCFWYGAAPMSAARLEEALDADRPGDGASSSGRPRRR